MADDHGPTPLGRLVRAMREQALLTQEDLAERTGLSLTMIRNLEAGRIRRPRSASVRALADVLATSDQDRQRLIVAATVEPAADRATAVPAQLPAAVPAFVGRIDALKALDEALPRALDDGSPNIPVVITSIGGTAGVGKTALAVHWAHRVASQFPEGHPSNGVCYSA